MLSSRTAGDNGHSNDDCHGNVDKPHGHCHVYCVDDKVHDRELAGCTPDCG